jgi:hypothetical protein
MDPIGGYFELEINCGSSHIYSDAYKFQSARAAFHSILEAGRPECVWMPRYICGAMISPLRSTGIPIKFYSLEEDFTVERGLILGDGEWLLYVNYFGICNTQEYMLLNRFNPSQLIFDHAQAFFSQSKNCLATIYSPRKFFGVPDGGYLLTSLPVKSPFSADTSILERIRPHLLRLEFNSELGYPDYIVSEKTFSNTVPRTISRLTENILGAINLDMVKEARNQNFLFLHSSLKRYNELDFDVASIDGPLCYPLMIYSPELRKKLLLNKIYVPKYWPETHLEVPIDSFEGRLAENCIPIPCDQRYSKLDMLRIIQLIEGLL